VAWFSAAVDTRPTPPRYNPAPEPVPTTPRPATGAGATIAAAPWLTGALDAPAPPTAAVVLHARPHQGFWVGGLGRITADERGEVRVSDPAVVEALLRSGCKAVLS